MGRPCLAMPSLRSGWRVANEWQRFQGSLCCSFRVRRGSPGVQPRHRLFRKVPVYKHQDGHSKLFVSWVPTIGSWAWVSTDKSQFGLFLVHHLNHYNRSIVRHHPLWLWSYDRTILPQFSSNLSAIHKKYNKKLDKEQHPKKEKKIHISISPSFFSPVTFSAEFYLIAFLLEDKSQNILL